MLEFNKLEEIQTNLKTILLKQFPFFRSSPCFLHYARNYDCCNAVSLFLAEERQQQNGAGFSTRLIYGYGPVIKLTLIAFYFFTFYFIPVKSKTFEVGIW